MAASDPLVEFIRARLDEDEDYARQAFADHNQAGPDWIEVRSGAIEVGEREDEIITFDSGISRHMVRHDPTRVLRGVEAKRRILEVHCPGQEVHRWNAPNLTSCAGCGFGGPCDDPFTEDINECPTLLAVASEWSDHADYREEWKP